MTEATHADQTRGTEFGKLLGQWNVRLAVGLPALLIGGASAVTEPVAGLIIFAVLLAIGLGIAFWVADSRSGRSFFAEWAGSRGLTPSKEPLGRQTTLLRSGDGQVTIKRWNGRLAPDLAGSVAHWSYARNPAPGEASSHPEWIEHTIVAVPVPSLANKLTELDVDAAPASPGPGLRTLRLESHRLEERYEISVHPDDDPVFVRRLFSPSFIVWLTEGHRPFQYGGGVLVTSRSGHAASAAALDGQIAGACEIARKLDAEGREGE